jgi:hypothetical protein
VNEAGTIDRFCDGKYKILGLTGFFFALNFVELEKNVGFQLLPFVFLPVVLLANLKNNH